MSANNDTFIKTIMVAIALCLACSMLVSSTAISLRDQQVSNAKLDKKRNILKAANLLDDNADMQALFDRVEQKFVDLESGTYVDIENPESFNQRRRAKEPELSIAIENDIAKIRRRSKVASIYLVNENKKVKTIILPIHGSGLFSTLYGFIALESDKQTIVGIKFYEHGETPGLGGEVDNPMWLAKWEGKKMLDPKGQPTLELVKSIPQGDSEVDALSGATWTSVGVQNMLNYWLGEQGFGPFLARLDVNTGEAS